MAIVNRKYLPGYTGTLTIDATDYPIGGWNSDADPGLWDATTPDDGGWMYQEPGLQKVSFTFDVYCKIGTGGAPSFPPFLAGTNFPAIFKINGTTAYAGNVIITKFSTKNDLKGGVTFSISADSNGLMTGSLAQAVVTPPAGGGS